MEMHEGEWVIGNMVQNAVPGGWLYSFQGVGDFTFVSDDYADHVVAYRRAQAKKHGLQLPEYLRPPHDPFGQSDAAFIADLAVALEVDPEASFDVIYTKAREVMAALKQSEDVPEVDNGEEA